MCKPCIHVHTSNLAIASSVHTFAQRLPASNGSPRQVYFGASLDRLTLILRYDLHFQLLLWIVAPTIAHLVLNQEAILCSSWVGRTANAVKQRYRALEPLPTWKCCCDSTFGFSCASPEKSFV